MHVELRVRTFMEICMKKELYYNNAYLKQLTGLEGYKECLLESSFDTSTSVKCPDRATRHQLGFEAGIVFTIKPGNYSNMWHLFALANITNCPITSVYPNVNGSLVNRTYMNIRIVPENAVKVHAVYLMWTSTQYSSFNGFTPNHFVPLMPVNKTQISLSNTITSECLPPQPTT